MTKYTGSVHIDGTPERDTAGASTDAQETQRVGADAAAPKKLTLRQKRRRMHNIVAAFQQYVAGYHKQPFYEDYSDRVFIDDMLYGMGIALTTEHAYANGFRVWKDALREHLADDAISEGAAAGEHRESQVNELGGSDRG